MAVLAARAVLAVWAVRAVRAVRTGGEAGGEEKRLIGSVGGGAVGAVVVSGEGEGEEGDVG